MNYILNIQTSAALETPSSSSTRELNEVVRGTPLLMRENSEKFDHETKPDLEKFAIGISHFPFSIY